VPQGAGSNSTSSLENKWIAMIIVVSVLFLLLFFAALWKSSHRVEGAENISDVDAIQSSNPVMMASPAGGAPAADGAGGLGGDDFNAFLDLPSWDDAIILDNPW